MEVRKEKTEEEDYYIEGLVEAFFNGPKFVKDRVMLHEILVGMKEKADEYAKKEEISDDYMETGLRELVDDLVEELYKYKVTRGE